jgi:SAM-dependent methyltransferase
MDDRLYPDLDYAFLRYTGVVPENMRRIQSFYLPFFEGRQRVLDLACGDGDFVQMLAEKGVSVIGIDFDPKACQAARARGLDVVCQDVLDYLEQVEPDSIDGIFSAHLVEHLNYRQALRMLELGLRALKPGGIILLATPNARSMYAHLESFYKHFGHVSFYHPELLCFFLDYVGFVNPQMGENPRMAAPLWGEPSISTRQQDAPLIPHLTYERRLPLLNDNLLRRAIRSVKMFWARMIVLPYMDQLLGGVNRLVTDVNLVAADVYRMRATLDRPVECYASAYKAEKRAE